jgi:hypothetical protein
MCLVNLPRSGRSPSPAPSQDVEANGGESSRRLPLNLSHPVKLVLHADFLSQESWCSRSSASVSDHIRLLLYRLEVLGTALQRVAELERAASHVPQLQQCTSGDEADLR